MVKRSRLKKSNKRQVKDICGYCGFPAARCACSYDEFGMLKGE
jgi:hypothetical protein